MCYEGVMDNLKIARQRYIEKKFEDKCKALQKALDIIDELLCSLDFEKGGAIARNLEALYNYMIRRILQADANRDIDSIDEVIGMLGELLSAWELVYSKQNLQVHPDAVSYHEDWRPKAVGYMGI